MQTRDYLNIGIKLLGVYFAVIGLTALALTLINLAGQMVQAAMQRDDILYSYEGPMTMVSFISALQPIAYLVCGFLLTRRTDWCLKLIGYPESGT